MTTGLIEKALKAALVTCDCFDETPMWENDGNFKKFLEEPRCDGLRWAVVFVTDNRKDDGCHVIHRGSYRILIYAPPGSGRQASRDAADCVICCLAAASPVTVTDDEDENVGLKLHFSDGGVKPSVRRRFPDQFGRAVTEIGVPYTAITCKC